MKLAAPKRLAFVLGNIAPDVNPFSYLIRSGENRLGGHNYDSRKAYMVNVWEKQKKRNSVTGWFQTGEMLHYLVDSFTRPHNSEFDYPVKEHVAYEHELHEHFTALLDSDNVSEQLKDALYISDFQKWLEDNHSDYIKQSKTIDEDTQYILGCTIAACRTLAAGAAVAGRQASPSLRPKTQPMVLLKPQPMVLSKPQPDTAS